MSGYINCFACTITTFLLKLGEVAKAAAFMSSINVYYMLLSSNVEKPSLFLSVDVGLSRFLSCVSIFRLIHMLISLQMLNILSVPMLLLLWWSLKEGFFRPRPLDLDNQL